MPKGWAFEQRTAACAYVTVHGRVLSAGSFKNVESSVMGQRTFAHPEVGFLVLEQATLAVSNVPDIKVVALMFTDTESIRRLRSDP